MLIAYNRFPVGVVRLERTTPCSQSRNANQLRYTPKLQGCEDREFFLFYSFKRFLVFFFPLLSS